MPNSIFLSYRREDSWEFTRLLHKALQEHFGPEQLFMDVSAIEAGSDFVATLRRELESCAVMLAIIGKRWSSLTDAQGRRIDNPDDYVRLEIATALERGITIIPVLVDGASMPTADELPPPLQPLAVRQSWEIRHTRFDADVNDLAQTLSATVDTDARAATADRAAHPREALDFVALRDGVSWLAESKLEDSTRGGGLLKLRMASQAELLADRWEDVPELQGHSELRISGDGSIDDVFNQCGRSLLLVGDPGSGKTIMLLTLATALVAESQRYRDAPCPAYLSLATWRSGRRSFRDWIASQLKTRYRIPTHVAGLLLEQQRLTLLLDGLDEVAPSDRDACIEAINDYLDTVGAPGVVVCSRITEYAAASHKLALNAAVRIKPLSEAQIASFVATSENEAARASLERALRDDPTLREQANSPLMLSIIRSVCEQETAPGADRDTAHAPDSRRQTLLESYVQSQLGRKSDAGYAHEQLTRWLAWLASSMTAHNQTELFVDEMQPTWLTDRRQIAIYAIGTCMFFGTAVATMGSLIWSIVAPLKHLELLLPGINRYSTLIFLVAPLWLLINSAIDTALFSYRANERFRRTIGAKVRTAVIFVVTWIAVNVAVFELLPDDDRSRYAETVVWAFTGFFFVGFLIAWNWIRPGELHEVHPVEALRWSNRGVAVGLGLGVAFGFVATLVWSALSAQLAVKMSYWDAFWWLLRHNLLGFVVLGQMWVVFTALVARTGRTSKGVGRGILPSLRITLMAGAFGGGWGLFIGWLFWTLMSGAFPNEFTDSPWAFSLGFGLMTFTAAFFWYGGADVLKHVTLRIALIASGKMPLFYLRFLDHASDLALLSREGRAYTFFHGLLQEHFATMHDGNDALEKAPG